MQQISPSEETSNLFARLSQRPGVQGTLILSRDTGAIVKSSGLEQDEDEEEVEQGTLVTSTANGVDGNTEAKGTRRSEEVARLVWNFTRATADMIQELNGQTDEAKLLRIRTKKVELVIVPDAKFLLVVIHDTPPA